MAFKQQYIDKVPAEGNAFSDYGTLCHELLEEWAKGVLPEFAQAEEYEKRYEKSVTHSFPPFPKGMSQKYYDAGLAYFNEFDGFGDDVEILTVEEKFEIDIEGYTFVGVADQVIRDKNTGEITVIDHKSKSASQMKKDLPTYRKQLYAYAAFVKQKFGVYPAKQQFNMFKEGTFIDEKFDLDEYNKTIQWIVDTIESILFEVDWMVSTSSYYCRFVCGCLDYCPAKDAVLNPPPKPKKEKKKKDDE